jgi:amino acid adenylation domain-containing protein
MKNYRKLIGELPREARERLADRNPLSFSQQRVWFLDQMDPENAAYNIPAAVRLEGALHLPALERSFNEIIRRHEVLRTTFPSFDGRPLQLIEPAYELPLRVIDISDSPLETREAEATRLAIQEISKPFDLTQLPLIRVLLLRLAEDDHVAVVTMHHIVSDGWSVAILIKELASLYNSFSRGEESSLPELPIQYADFAHWQRDRISDEELDRQLDFWKKQVAGAAPRLELPADFARPVSQTFNGAEFPFELSTELSAAVKSLSRRKQTTEITLLMAAFIALLHRYTEQRNIVIGLPVAGRNRVELEQLIGFFVNTLIIRSDLSPEVTFSELIDRVHETALNAYAHQDLPFEKLVEHLQPARHLGATPLFQVMFVPQNSSNEAVNLNGLRLSPHKLDNRTAKFDLILCMGETGRGWSGALEYNTDLFRPHTMKRMADHFQTLLRRGIENPDQSVMSIAMLDEAERQRLLFEFNEWGVQFGGNSLIHEEVERQAEQRPRATAVQCEGEELSYEELNRRANQLAHYLLRLGVGAETAVAVYLEPSLEMVISLLAILKAGGGYVPLSPACPAERLSFMLEDTRARLVLTRETSLPLLPEKRPEAICLDSEMESIACESAENPAVALSADNVAYVIYTSGSTGVPKGVMVTHRNVSRLFEATEEKFGFDERDVWTLFHSYAFDFSVWELWGALRYGGKVVVIPYWMSRSPETFFEHLVEQKVTVLSQTPSAFNQMMRVDESEGGGSDLALKTVVFGGEALQPGNLRGWAERRGLARPRLINMYGITETTVHVTYHGVTEADVAAAGSSVVGRPLADLQVHILDERMQPAPVGLGGQMYVAGSGLARGYLNRPGLTAERFIPNPFSASGGRLYQTGDKARYREDGTIEYLGRVDQQVKIRGFRVELGEIEAALRAHAAVAQCVVIVREDNAEEKRIVAYVTPQPHQTLSVGELRECLKQQLPDYMLPAAFIAIDEIPLTQNGKLDVSALPEPDGERPKLEKEYVAPRTTVEEQLARIWARMLKIDKVGIHDNFFELGGHSLLATQVISQVREAFMVELSPRRLFEEPTIERLAILITQLRASRQNADEIDEWLNRIENLTEAEARALLEATL